MLKRLLIIIIYFWTGVVFAQTFNASISKTEIGLNEEFEITFTIEGGDPNAVSGFTPPSFTDFIVLTGPNQSTRMQIINGQMSASRSYSYYLQPRKIGKFTIGPASVNIGGNIFRSNSITLEVLKASVNQSARSQNELSDPSTDKNIAENLFIRAEIDKSSAYVGEQITVVYKLYTRLNVASLQVAKMPNYQGFWAEELTSAKNIDLKNTTYNGKQFRVGILKRAALFPTKEGRLNVTPLELKIPVVIQKQRKSGNIFDDFFNDPFFSQTQTVEYTAKSNSLFVDAKPLPTSGRPSSFNGAVGNFQFKVEVDKDKVKTNEPISLKIQFSGTGNIKLLPAPEIKFPQGLEKYEPKINESIDNSNLISGRKTIEYLLIPRTSGVKEIPAIEFSYFDPRARKYISTTSEKIVLNIEKGEGGYDQNISGYSKSDIELLSEDIRYIKLSSSSFSRIGEYAIFKTSFWMMVFFPLAALAGFALFFKKKFELEANSSLLLFKRAENIAKKRLRSAKKALDLMDKEKFYEEITLALFGYFENKLKISKADFSLDKVERKLEDFNSPSELLEQIKEVAEKCQFARYAPSVDLSSEMNIMYGKAVEIIVNSEKVISSKNVEKKS